MLHSCALWMISTGLALPGQNNPADSPAGPGSVPGRPPESQPMPRPGRFSQTQPGSPATVAPGSIPAQPPETSPFPRPGRFSRTEPGAEMGPPTRDQPPLRHPRDKTLLVEVKQAKADILAKSLQRTFGDTMTVEVAAGTPVSAILLAGTEKSVQEARELIEKLDKPAGTATVELTVVESAGNPDDLAGQIRDATMAGQVTDEAWRSLVKKLQNEGKIAFFRTLEVKAAENQQARIQVGEEKPIATGSVVTARGIGSRNFTYRNVGTMATLTLRPGKTGEYRVDLNFQDSRILAAKPQPEASKEKDKDKEKEKERAVGEFQPDSVLTFTIDTSADLSRGKVIRINSNREEGKEGTRQVLVFLRLKSS